MVPASNQLRVTTLSAGPSAQLRRIPRSSRLGAMLGAVGLVFSGSVAWAGSFAADWNGGLESGATLVGSASAAGGKIVLTNAAGQDGRVILDDLDPGNAVDRFSACTTLFISNSGGGADGFSFNFGDPTSLSAPEEGVTDGLAVSLDTYDNGGGDASGVVVVLYDGSAVATSAATTLRTGNFVSLCVTVRPDGQVIVRHDNTTVDATIPGWSAEAGRQFVWAAKTGGLFDEHTIDAVTVATFPTAAFYEDYANDGSTPAATSYYGNARHDDFYLRLTDNAGSQVGSGIIDDLNPGTAVTSLVATFAKYIDNGGGADGLSFNFGPMPPSPFGEGGPPATAADDGLTVSWATYSNDRIRVYYDGSLVGESGPRDLRGPWSRVSISVDASGKVAVSDSNDGDAAVAFIGSIPGWAPAPGWQVGFGGRTGGVTDNHAITQLSLETGVCGDSSIDAGEQCDDGAANGTVNSCCSSTCSYQAAGTSCDDANAATVNDTCSASGVCAGVDLCDGVVCSNGDQCNDNGTCDPMTGACGAATPVTDGTVCDDANATTVNDACNGGTCAGQDLCAGVTCSNGDQCNEAGTCDSLTGLCGAATPVADNSACDDGDSGTGGDVCQAGVCTGDPVPAVPSSSSAAMILQILLMMVAGFGLLLARRVPIKRRR